MTFTTRLAAVLKGSPGRPTAGKGGDLGIGMESQLVEGQHTPALLEGGTGQFHYIVSEPSPWQEDRLQSC